ncbi:fimbrial protein [Proteus penneri]|uniref:fimbrial protein n=1 Tax=Proteus penneri TaxID=102862 RepID=UPI0034D5A910
MKGIPPIVTILSLSTCILAQPVYAVNENSSVDGLYGVIYVHGILTESACRLDMNSLYQTIDLGTFNTGQLIREGHGNPVAIHLKLRDCIRSPAIGEDKWTSTKIWDPSQPSVTVKFSGVTSIESPTLLHVNGVSGMGLKISNEQGQDVRIGSGTAPLSTVSRNGVLTYYVTPQKTGHVIKGGIFSTQINFQLNYD